MLIYYCATSYEDIHVINGGGRGSILSEIEKIPPSAIDKLKSKDVFLDKTTGDYYSFNIVIFFLSSTNCPNLGKPIMDSIRKHRTPSYKNNCGIWRSQWCFHGENENL
jgi:hypothetical protein